MKDFKINNKGTTQLFQNRILEGLTRTNFMLPVVFYYVLAATFICLSVFNHVGIASYWWLFPAGMIVFSLVEYLIHRFVFHFKAVTAKEIQLQYNIHGVHHEFPRDKDRLVMPPVISILLAAIFYELFQATMGRTGWIFFAGFVAGYSTYLLIHYAVHALHPPNNFLKYLWKHHSLHHYSSVNAAYSVSFPLWDILFGSMPVKSKSAKEDEEKLPDSRPVS